MGPTVTINKPKNKKRRKVNLVFNDEKRREFLGGFHKRKVQRQKKAQEELQKQLKDERKRLKQDARESYKKLVVSHRPIPELEELMEGEYETEDVTVKVVELSTAQLAVQNNWIGANRPRYEGEDSTDAESEKELSETDELPGMALKNKLQDSLKPSKSSEKKDSKLDDTQQQFKNKQEMRKVLKKQATKNVQKSRAFQMKGKLERQKNKKKSLQQKKQRVKLHTKRAKHKGRQMAKE